MGKKSHRNLAGILAVIGIVCLVSTLLLAEDYNFAGTWKGESGQAPAAPGGATAGTATKGGGGGGRGGGGFGGPQKITLRVASVNKEKGTAKGNFTMGTSTEDIREAKIMGNKLIFKTGLPPAQLYDYEAVFIGDELSVTRTASGGRGGFPSTFKLTKNK
jgi:hypothetical protein